MNKLVLGVVYCLSITTQYVHCEGTERSVRVTNEVEMTFVLDNYQGSGEQKELKAEIALFAEEAPMSVMNFLGLCRGYNKKGRTLHYVGTPVHRVVPDFVIQMGDVMNKDGTGGHSIYGATFDDEVFELSHVSKGWLGMANTGKNTNGSQFYITLVRARWLDKSHVVFGKVIKGLTAVDDIGETPASRVTAYPKRRIMITGCRELDTERKWTMSEEQMFSNEDIRV